MSILYNNTYQVRVSSVLNKDVQTSGKQFMFDNNDETCWCSDQGNPQWVTVMFQNTVFITGVQIQFQGGFVGRNCQAIFHTERDQETFDFYPEDNNKVQKFTFTPTNCSKITLCFPTSTDFFGRIIIYKLDILDEKENAYT